MLKKIGIIIKNVKAPIVSSKEIKSILSTLGTNSIDIIFCESFLEAKEIIREKYKEISFIYLTAPIPKIEKSIYRFVEFITNHVNYKHIEFFARMPKMKKESKYTWYDDFINFIKL